MFTTFCIRRGLYIMPLSILFPHTTCCIYKVLYVCTANLHTQHSSLFCSPDGSNFVQSTIELSRAKIFRATPGNTLQLFVFMHTTKSFPSLPSSHVPHRQGSIILPSKPQSEFFCLPALVPLPCCQTNMHRVDS